MPHPLYPFKKEKIVIITSIFLFFISVIFIKKFPLKIKLTSIFPDPRSAVNQVDDALGEKYLGVPTLTILIPYNFSSNNELSILRKIEQIEEVIKAIQTLKLSLQMN